MTVVANQVTKFCLTLLETVRGVSIMAKHLNASGRIFLYLPYLANEKKYKQVFRLERLKTLDLVFSFCSAPRGMGLRGWLGERMEVYSLALAFLNKPTYQIWTSYYT